MKKALLLIAIVLGLIKVHAQSNSTNFKLVFGEEQKVLLSEFMDGIVHIDESGIYTMRTELKSFYRSNSYIDKYDHDLTKLKSVQVVVDKNFVAFRSFNEKIYLFTTETDNKRLIQSIYASHLQLQDWK